MNEKFLERIVTQMNNDSMDAMLIVPSEELKMLIGIKPLLCERFQGLFIKSDGECFYFCNLLTGDEIKDVLDEQMVYTWFDNEMFTKALEHVLAEKGLIGKIVGINGSARAFNIKRIENAFEIYFVDGKHIVEQANMIKSEEELQNLRISARLTDEVMTETIDFVRPGRTEREIIECVQSAFLKRGCEPDFALIASGPNSALPHYTGDERVVMEKDIVLMDIGGKYRGYSSDITRTIFVGEPTIRMKKVYDLVRQANLAGENACALGNPVAEVDIASRGVIESAGYGEYFTTRLGHGIGYSTHEEPYINQLSNRLLQTGMAFTIEPGIYLRGEFGIRIEDTVIMTSEGPEILNCVSKEMIIV